MNALTSLPTNGSQIPALPTEPSTPALFNAGEVVSVLLGAMKRVIKEDCTPERVLAACQAAGQITGLLKVHLEYLRIQQQSHRQAIRGGD